MVSNSKPIETVLSEALDNLRTTGTPNLPALVAAYPEHTKELAEMVPMIQVVGEELPWLLVGEKGKQDAKNLAPLLTSQAGEG